MLDRHPDAEHGAHDGQSGDTLYRRPMPGGGYVEVELEVARVSADGTSGSWRHRGRVVMERRADPGRRFGHRAPVIVELARDDRDELMSELFQLAQDNVALARSLLRLQATRQRAD
jgi:Glu-tRNA(Gln) amidotransferase subunit E-like FAD-binding protein